MGDFRPLSATSGVVSISVPVITGELVSSLVWAMSASSLLSVWRVVGIIAVAICLDCLARLAKPV